MMKVQKRTWMYFFHGDQFLMTYAFHSQPCLCFFLVSSNLPLQGSQVSSA